MKNHNVIGKFFAFFSIAIALAFIFYVFIIFQRTEYGSHQTSIGSDVILITHLFAILGVGGLALSDIKRWLPYRIGLAMCSVTIVVFLLFFWLIHWDKVLDRSSAQRIQVSSELQSCK